MADLVVDVDEAAVRGSALSRAAERVAATEVVRHLEEVTAAVPGGRLSRAASELRSARAADREALEALLRAHATAAREAADALVTLDLRLAR